MIHSKETGSATEIGSNKLMHIWSLVFTLSFFTSKGKVQSMQSIVSEHEQYLDALRDFNDWLISAKEELQRWSDLSGDSVSIKRKLSKVQVSDKMLFL